MVGLDVKQFRELVVRPTLEQIDLWSEAAENLVVGTAVQESRLCFLKQKGGGPALGVYQPEPATHADVWVNFLRFRSGLARKVKALAPSNGMLVGSPPPHPSHTQLITNLAYATAICRVIYYRRPEPLPAADDIPGLAAYWKQHYNTPRGAGTAMEWEDNYRRYCE